MLESSPGRAGPVTPVRAAWWGTPTLTWDKVLLQIPLKTRNGDSQGCTKDHSPPNQTVPEPMEQLPRLFLATSASCMHQLSNKYGEPGEAPRSSLISVDWQFLGCVYTQPLKSNPRFTFYHRSLPSFQLFLDLIPPRQVLERGHSSLRPQSCNKIIPVKGKFLMDFPQTLGQKNNIAVQAALIWVPFPGGHPWFVLWLLDPDPFSRNARHKELC